MTPGPNPAVLIALTVMALAGCASTPPPDSIKSPNSQLEHCPRSLGTLSLVEQERQPGRNRSGSDADLPGPMPLLRLMVKSSNCFTLAQHTPSLSERTLTTSDYTATPSLSFGDDAAARIGSLHEVALHPSTLLVLTDNRSGAELAAAQGSASYWRFGAAGGFFNGGFAGAGGYTRTPQGKVLTAALVDSYNQMVRSLRNHTARGASGRLADAGGLRLSRAAPSAPQRSQ
ncbi:hypothetical protein RBA41_18895 [Massilia sp. CCM 9210]|uniref:hypothetical protein n=1 Tax=Massilia scottii TaxID=3057166 RepID=UPI0027965C6E|nr:hypothetical protein [Massilia sp. CCM 9210]MDQ1815373.1 hypothetical protein [Massilia sp. CCM 9210]